MKKVFEARNHAEAHLVAGLLEAEGFPAHVRGEALFTTVEGGAAVAGMCPSVWVVEDRHADPCAELLERFRRGEALHAEEAEPWVCPGCGERHEPPFEACWRCGTSRGGPS
jgi:rubrerythrin